MFKKYIYPRKFDLLFLAVLFIYSVAKVANVPHVSRIWIVKM